MYRQQAERLAGKLGINRPDLSVDVYQDGIRSASWLVRIYDPVSRQTFAVDGEHEAVTAVSRLGEHGRFAGR